MFYYMWIEGYMTNISPGMIELYLLVESDVLFGLLVRVWQLLRLNLLAILKG